MLEAFKSLAEAGEVEYKQVLMKSKSVQTNTDATKAKLLGLEKKVAIDLQLKGRGSQGFSAFPKSICILILLFMENHLWTLCLALIVVGDLPLVWDCKMASCQHTYYSWCAIAPFSEFTTCLLKDCQKTMHPDWWTNSGISMLDERKIISRAPLPERVPGRGEKRTHLNGQVNVSCTISCASGKLGKLLHFFVWVCTHVSDIYNVLKCNTY